jgi:hypothetical protein
VAGAAALGDGVEPAFLIIHDHLEGGRTLKARAPCAVNEDVPSLMQIKTDTAGYNSGEEEVGTWAGRREGQRE